MLLLSERSCPADVQPEQNSDQIRMSQRLFSFPVVIGALLVVLTVLTVRERFNDSDMWWHLKVGEIIWNTHTIPTSDQFSFTTNNHAWIPHEWLAEVSIYAVWKFGGYTGLMVWMCILESLLLIASYTLCSLYSGNAKVALVGALITWLFSTVGLAIRPHLIGYLLLACELLVIYLGRTRDRRYLLLLPLMFGVWVNCHGSFFLGLLVFSIVLFCSFLELHIGQVTSTSWNKRTRRFLVAAFVLSVAALAVNPIGLPQAVYPVTVMLNLPENLKFVSEWQPLTFDGPRDVAFLAVLALTVLLLLVRQTTIQLQDLLVIGVTSWLAIRHTRMLFVFGILIAPIICRLISDLWESYTLSRDRRLPNVVMLILSSAVLAVAFPSRADLERQVRERSPVGAVDFLRGNQLLGPVLNEYEYGGYLIWSLPEHKVFIDGRGDVFEWSGVFREYGAWATLQENPTLLLKKYGIALCILSKGSPMTSVFPYLRGWRIVYADSVAVIFAREGDAAGLAKADLSGGA